MQMQAAGEDVPPGVEFWNQYSVPEINVGIVGFGCRRGAHAFQDRTSGATHIEMRVAKPKQKDKAFVDQAAAKFKENITKAVGNLRLMLEEQQTPHAVIDEPPLIASSERFLTEAVKSSAS